MYYERPFRRLKGGKKVRVCEKCGRTSEKYRIIKSKKYGMICERCNQRERNNPITYELPEYGEVAYSPEGKPICHICGKAFDKLIAHVWQIHRLRAREYKKEFGLDVIKGIMSKESTEIARQRNKENYDLVVEENLLKNGKKSRFKDEHRGRTKDQVSEQTRRRLIKQLRVNEKKEA